ncbi:MAG: hypothetical protein C0622_11575 [Desulfuromonas sp.]|nr:MAG: hypothetical protein C0622_11575 [Desulfuromonas sp.]
MSLKPELLEILVCPKCKQEIQANEDASLLSCEQCRLRFPVRDGIPVLLSDEAESY